MPNLYRGLSRVPNTSHIAAIGKFDGLHLGHQGILERMKELKQENSAQSLIISFYPNPVEVLNPGKDIKYLHTLRQRLKYLERYDLDSLLMFLFSYTFSRKSAREFVEDLLIKRLNIKHLLIGPDAAVGHNREGNVNFIKEVFASHQREVEVINFVEYNNSKIGTVWLRSAIESGDLDTYFQLTGRNYVMQSVVVHGDGRGHKIGFPTVNLQDRGQLMPHSGIYATRTKVAEQVYDSVTSVGFRPTFNGQDKLIETYIIDFNQDLYGQRIEVEYIKYLRDELKYDSVEELCRQINADIKHAKKVLLES